MNSTIAWNLTKGMDTWAGGSAMISTRIIRTVLAAVSKVVCGVTLVTSLTACEKAKDALSKVDKTEISVQYCNPSIPATGERHKVPNPSRPSFCTVPVMWCSYCEYSGAGQLLSSGSHPCGACLGAETP